MSETTVGDPTPTMVAQTPAWEMVDDLWGGTKSMRLAKERWLPKEPKEATKAYELRVERSFLFNGYRQAVQMISGKPFGKPVTLRESEKLPEPLDAIEENVDRTNRGLSKFAEECLRWGVHYGLHHVLVDFPARDASTPRTLEDDRRERVRPLFIHVKARDVLGFSTVEENGVQVLDMIRFRDNRVEPEPDGFGEIEIDRVRVYTRTEWAVYRRENDDDDYVLEGSGAHSFGSVPIFTYYVNRTGYMQGQPALEDLAWTNVAHWQSSSDQRSILRFARVGILFFSGLSEEEKKQEIQVGANRVLKATNENAKGTYVEHSGASIQAGERDITKLEEQMQRFALQPFVQRSGGMTATARALDTAESDSQIQTWVRGLEAFIRDLYEAAAKWVSVELPFEFAVSIQKDFTISLSGTEDLTELREMVVAGLISHETYLREVKRRGLLHESTDVEEELERVSSEAPRELGVEPPVEDVPRDVEPDDEPDERDQVAEEPEVTSG